MENKYGWNYLRSKITKLLFNKMDADKMIDLNINLDNLLKTFSLHYRY